MPPPPPPVPPPSGYPPIIIILLTTVLFFFFFGFFTIYFCRGILGRWHLRHSSTTPRGGTAPPSAASSRPGLDPFLIQSFPTFTYSTVKAFHKEKYGLECAICLVEFKGEDILRLLTPCYHVFHQECVDLWLAGHQTCPVCRRNLDSPVAQSPIKSPSLGAADQVDETMVGSQSYNITIKDGEDEENHDSRDMARSEVEKYMRSHSTGHSLAASEEGREDLDRYTLVLPEHVRSSIIRGHHNPSQSWPTFGVCKRKSKDIRERSGVAEEVSAVSDGGESRV